MHTPTPWHVNELMRFGNHINSERGQVGVTLSTDDAAFIVQACNAHDALVAALTEAIDLIRIWHGIHNGAAAWNIYAEHSPEVKRLNAALALVLPKEAVR